jgi:hypothetical protein
MCKRSVLDDLIRVSTASEIRRFVRARPGNSDDDDRTATIVERIEVTSDKRPTSLERTEDIFLEAYQRKQLNVSQSDNLREERERVVCD